MSGWGHILAIACLSACCFVWVLIQRTSGRGDDAINGGCGACGRPPEVACGGRTCEKKTGGPNPATETTT